MPNKENKSPLESSGMDIPDYAIERMARCLLPMMQKYYENTEERVNACYQQYQQQDKASA